MAKEKPVMANHPVLAAGAVLWRHAENDAIEFALVHRPRYDDWTLPKGKQEISEHPLTCAAREVREETGVIAHFGPWLAEVSYEVEGEMKIVNYWAARAVEMGQPSAPDSEIDRVQWLSPTAAKALLTYEHDKEIIDAFLEMGTGTTPIVLLRHTKAVKRSEWDGVDDDDRPLDSKGEIQARKLPAILGAYGRLAVHASDANRCQQTAAALAEYWHTAIRTESALSEYAYKRSPGSALSRAKELLQLGEGLVLVSHRPVLPHLLDAMLEGNELEAPLPNLEPGAAWVIHARGGVVISVDYIPAS